MSEDDSKIKRGTLSNNYTISHNFYSVKRNLTTLKNTEHFKPLGIAGLVHEYAELFPTICVLIPVSVMPCREPKEYNKNQQISCTKNVFSWSSEYHDPETPGLQFESRCALLPCSNIYFGEVQMVYLYLVFFSSNFEKEQSFFFQLLSN